VAPKGAQNSELIQSPDVVLAYNTRHIDLPETPPPATPIPHCKILAAQKTIALQQLSASEIILTYENKRVTYFFEAKKKSLDALGPGAPTWHFCL
jgi:hypothetical protein